MATITAVPVETQAQLTPGKALRVAWLCWLILLAIPALLFLGVFWTLDRTAAAPANSTLAQQWFLGSMIYLAVVMPLAFFGRSRLFRCYWEGCAVSPANYLKGMLLVWVAAEIGGIISLIGCIVSSSLLPCLVPAMVAFILFTPFWPSGRAMTNPVGNDPDFEVYEEPR